MAAFAGEGFDNYDLTDAASLAASRRSTYEFAELYVPIFAPEQGVQLVNRLSLSAAIRHENYSDFGGVTTAEARIVYEPTADFSAKASWGRSFKAPTLFQAYQLQYAELWPAATLGAAGYPDSETALVNDGGNPNLRPERASTWTATLELHPAALPRLHAQASYFHIDYTDRVIQPVTNAAAAFSDPMYTPYLDYNPTPAQQQALINSVPTGLSNLTGAAYDPANVLAVVRDLFVNVASQTDPRRRSFRGLSFRSGPRHARSEREASWLVSTQRNSPGDPSLDLAGTEFNPPHWRSRTGVSWQYGGGENGGFP